MTYKTIFVGRLEFGNSRSYEKVLKMYQHRLESYYKSDVLLEEEDMFDEAGTSLNIPRYITMGTEKSWKNTLGLLEYIAQFAVAGSLDAWMIENGKVIRHGLVEPNCDKVVVREYIRGRELVEEEGKEKEAMDALSKAISRFERHAQAYERRGYINFRMKNYDDALYDFSKSIKLYPNNPEAFFGRANVFLKKGKINKAIEDLGSCIKSSIPLQPIYWKARKLKGECHMCLGEYEQSVVEFKLFTNRRFTEDNPNYSFRETVYFNYGKSLLEIEKFQDALGAFNSAVNLSEEAKNSKAEHFLYRGIALQRTGHAGFMEDWQEAADMGSKEAEKLLEMNA